MVTDLIITVPAESREAGAFPWNPEKLGDLEFPTVSLQENVRTGAGAAHLPHVQVSETPSALLLKKGRGEKRKCFKTGSKE